MQLVQPTSKLLLERQQARINLAAGHQVTCVPFTEYGALRFAVSIEQKIALFLSALIAQSRLVHPAAIITRNAYLETP
jgi:hypothetical protein